MKILLAVDGSPFSDAALEEVGKRPWPGNSQVMVVTAFEAPLAATPEVWALPPDYYDQIEHSVRLRADSVMETAVAELIKTLGPEVEVKGKCVAGSPQRVILDEAENWQADLIVVGSHGYPAWERLLLGSVSQAVVAHAKCSVEVVRGRAGRKVANN
jgi:nucleotide-binding universal stress UspA family protein